MNICIISFDAARPMNFSCYGHDRFTTPYIERIAKESVVFENAVTPSSVTFDSITSLLSGRYPSEHLSGAQMQVNVDSEMLTEVLNDFGYNVAIATSSPSTTPAFGFDRGVDEFGDVTNQFSKGMNMRKFYGKTKDMHPLKRYTLFLKKAVGPHFFSNIGNGFRFKFGYPEHGDDGAEMITQFVTNWIDSAEEPWFCYAHFTETHMNNANQIPYKLPKDAVYRFIDEDFDISDLVTRFDDKVYDDHMRDIHEKMYDAAIRYLDSKVATIEQMLRNTGQWEDTLFIVMSDHGELIGEHNGLGHGFPYEECLRVPLIMKIPGVGPKHVEQRRNTIDIYRTICNLLDISDIDPRVKGTSLLEDREEHWILSQHFSGMWDWSRYGDEKPDGEQVLYIDDMKMIDRGDSAEIYNLDNDPNETEDLSYDSELLHTMREEMESILSSLHTVEEIEEPDEIDEGTKERLQDLGYI